MAASVKVNLAAYVPANTLRAFLQHIRDFDADNDGCHFQFLAVDMGSELSVDEANAIIDSIDPPFDLRGLIRAQ